MFHITVMCTIAAATRVLHPINHLRPCCQIHLKKYNVFLRNLTMMSERENANKSWSQKDLHLPLCGSRFYGYYGIG